MINNDNHFIFNHALSQGNEECENILIKGDNKLILPELAKSHRGKVKCVYIDPPYNNGDKYHFYNDKTSEVDWLKSMRYVLTYIKELLCKDGSVWISIDDTEMAYLKLEADKVFGRDNYAATIIWQQRKSRENRAIFSFNHEYILVYTKDIKQFKKSRNLLPVEEDFFDSRYKNPDNDSRGPWQSVTASVQAGHAVPSQFYTITSPSGMIFSPPKGRCWAYNEERMLREIKEGNIWFGANGDNTPRIKKFLKDAKLGLTPQTLWAGDNYGTTDSAKKHLLSLFSNHDNIFDTPKPEELIKQIIEIASNEGEIVLDCFLGSGTTIATAHKLKRHYIGIEIGDQMSDLVVKRIKAVISGEQGGISRAVNWNGGGEFAFFDFLKENYKPTQTNSLSATAINKTSKPSAYPQLNLWSLFEEFGDEAIAENALAEDDFSVDYGLNISTVKNNVSYENALVSLVKKDNENQFINKSATIYYTGKRFPKTVSLNTLKFFIPYIKGKGIKDLWLVKKIRVGFRKEGSPEEDKDDLRLIFELKYIGKLYQDYQSFSLKIWRTYTDTRLKEVLDL